MKVLITGGAGYIGTELCIKLNKNPKVKEIVVLDNLSRGNYNLFLHSQIKPGKLKFMKAELLDSRSLDKVVKDVDVVYHFAAENKDDEKLHHLHEQVNNWGTAELTYAIEASHVKQVIYLSSVAVYGDSKSEKSSESMVEPNTSFGNSKRRGEQHIERLGDKIKTHILRLGEVFGYGASLNMDGILNSYMFDSHFVGRISIQGNGKQEQSFISLNKTVEILSNLLDHELEGGIYNLVDDQKSVLDLIDALKALNPDMEMVFTNNHLELPNHIAKADEAILALYTSPELSFEEELKGFKEHLQASS
ncbi:SDR family NAD-dependent epimerase/dehydratase [Ancylomarina euxinus]|uniref:SDR family NAD-dependent epimerase/dehydratase n=1 Tax=Ancylomarina euxinus TaxID=2283627 RepID=A0A425Y3D9_9BACT|nr:SDR family oxidoreductase [Ancylomarina euxinus]MCZ4693214.1 SDR family oxidoreductase [Ancylomarina euxinus]MUP15350.1 NAD-dependent epimerase/dehydratase family protein [Ancylomarina euxinus]RRG22524.1 SDR family NAD-dependent epimerase/dehydratase [Ancylomarina euxinus]